jgi:hypothetical protein
MPPATAKPVPPPVPAKPPAPQRRPTPPHLPAQASQPPKGNGRQQPADFSTLPPAIAQSLAKLAGRTVPPLSREEAAAASADAGEPPSEDKPRQS